MARGNFPSSIADAFSVRMPDGMRDRIKAAAAANNRPMNAEIVFRLEASFEAPRALAPELARLIDQYLDQEVQRRLREIASKIGGAA